MFDCRTENYGELYSPWLVRSGDLLDWADATLNDSLLDLCGGTGAVAQDALKRGLTDVWLFDLNPRCGDGRVHEVQGAAEELLLSPYLTRTFSLVVCRQALGYLDLEKIADGVHRVLEPGGRFVFNNFLQPRWGWKWYRHDDRSFLEISGHLGNRVVHLQASPTIGADVSVFRWHKHEDVLAAFRTRFDISFEERGRSGRYLCRKAER